MSIGLKKLALAQAHSEPSKPSKPDRFILQCTDVILEKNYKHSLFKTTDALLALAILIYSAILPIT